MPYTDHNGSSDSPNKYFIPPIYTVDDNVPPAFCDGETSVEPKLYTTDNAIIFCKRNGLIFLILLPKPTHAGACRRVYISLLKMFRCACIFEQGAKERTCAIKCIPRENLTARETCEQGRNASQFSAGTVHLTIIDEYETSSLAAGFLLRWFSCT